MFPKKALSMKKYRVLFVCTGNICRSPTAEGIFQHQSTKLGLQDHLFCDSAGTTAYHVGEGPDSRTQDAAKQRGYDLSKLRARKLTIADFDQFDLLLAMDHSHLDAMQRLKPNNSKGKIALFLDFAPASQIQNIKDVPDPYYGGPAGFDHVLDLVEAGVSGLLTSLQQAPL